MQLTFRVGTADHFAAVCCLIAYLLFAALATIGIMVLQFSKISPALTDQPYFLQSFDYDEHISVITSPFLRFFSGAKKIPKLNHVNFCLLTTPEQPTNQPEVAAAAAASY